jgi:prepilin-type N-terminal cleavage/methylation domain-containing protein
MKKKLLLTKIAKLTRNSLSSKFSKAFSLIELSIVILIIGILVAGVTQSSRLIRQMALSSARGLTQSSPVPSITGLVSWYETVSEKSFDELEASDNSTTTNWYDINPTSANKINLNQTDPARRPTYVANGLNGLPSLRFNGSTTYLQSNGFIPEHNSNNFSLFIVTMNSLNAVSSHKAIFCNRFGPPPFNILRGLTIYSVSNTYNLTMGTGVNWDGPSGHTIVNGVADIITLIRDTNSGTLYKNGLNPIVRTVVYAPNLIRPTSIGSNSACDLTNDYFFNGYINEIIIYNRNLSNDERQDVEKYLAKKWAIKP